MDVLQETFEWFGDPSHWSGSAGVPARVVEHLYISLLSLSLAALVALPAGLFIGHTKRAEFLVVSIANLGRAIPSFAILAIMLPITIRMGLGLGFWPTVIALFLLGIPPILTNSYVGVQGIEADTVEAARGTGMSEMQVLMKLEVPLAAPLIATGLRTALVQIIATATLAALVAWGGLGRFIIDGFATRDDPQIAAGALLVALLAIAAELTFALLERAFSPRTHSELKQKRSIAPGVEEARSGAAA